MLLLNGELQRIRIILKFRLFFCLVNLKRLTLPGLWLARGILTSWCPAQPQGPWPSQSSESCNWHTRPPHPCWTYLGHGSVATEVFLEQRQWRSSVSDSCSHEVRVSRPSSVIATIPVGNLNVQPWAVTQYC